ncbi:MAG TPA: efflux RND transporter permease subunit [Verrucomicrobiales bacterium]|nr:efflux RND transporter permease subunit [Verrucomicrobiales bacterium]
MRANELATGITRLSLSRRVTVFVLFLTILAVGLIATNRLPLEKYPKGQEGHSIEIRTSWNSGVAQEAMEKIGLPMEEELSTVRGIESMSSRSSPTAAAVSLRFTRGTEMDVAYREVRDRMERVSLRFPEGVDGYRISKRGGGSATVCRLIIGYNTDSDHYTVIDKHVLRPLQRIDGVADVNINLDRKEILIEIDKKRAEAYGLSINRIARRLRDDNFTLSSGTVRDGGKKYLLKSSSTYLTMAEIRDIPVSETVFLRDIATIKYEAEDPYHHVERWNQQMAATVSVLKESSANTVEVSERVVAAVERMQANPALSSYEISLYQNYGEIIINRLNTLLENGMLGALLAGVILYFFLRQFRMTMIIAMAIPLCLLISMTVMYFSGETLNMTTILGLVICVGLLVDNSVVVAENIQRHYQSGLSRRDACLKGVGEIGLAVTTATLTTVIVFLPSLLVGGQMRFLLYRLALPVVSALLASLGTALVFIPLCVYLTLSSKSEQQNGARRKREFIKTFLVAAYDKTFGKFNDGYNHALGYYLKRRLDLAFILILLLSGTYFYAFEKLEFSQARSEEISEFHLSIRFPDHFSIEQRDDYFKRIENVVETNKVEYGIASYTVKYHKFSGNFEGNFTKEITSDIPREEVADLLYKQFPEVPGLRVYYSGMEPGEKRNDKRSRYYIRLVGDNSLQLEEVGESLKPVFEALPGVVSLEDQDSDDAPNELALIVDRDRASSIGVNPNDIAGVIGSALRGSTLPRFNSSGRQIPVRMRFREEDRAELHDLNSYLVPTDEGGFASIGSITKPAMLKSEGFVRRTNKKISYTIGMKLKSGEEREARKAIENAKRNIDLPEGVSFSEIKVTFDDNEISASLMAMGLSIVFIYMLIAFLFESILMPLSIVLTIPLAAIGSMWLHYFTGTSMDQMGIVGGILLIGVVVNNGIVLVDYVNRMRRTGMDRAEALLLATRHRFRPIVMTALTTIFGMIPLTLASASEMGMSFKSFGYMLIGGMTSATLFTLLAVPVFYTLIDDAQKVLGNIIASVFDRSPRPNFERPSIN